MALKLTLKPNERIIVNGCAMRNSGRRHVMIVESHADVVRGNDLLEPDDAATPVTRVYFLIQTVLTRADLRQKLVPKIQGDLAELVPIFSGPLRDEVFMAAHYMSIGDYYKALRALRPLLTREAELLAYDIGTAARTAAE